MMIIIIKHFQWKTKPIKFRTLFSEDMPEMELKDLEQEEEEEEEEEEYSPKQKRRRKPRLNRVTVETIVIIG